MAQKRLPAVQLKFIAIIAMTIDHTARILSEFTSSNILYVMVIIGRITFPIMAYFLIEGYKYTSNKWLYISRLGIVGLISMYPCYLVNHVYGDVLLTLCIALCLIHIDYLLCNKFPMYKVYIKSLLTLVAIYISINYCNTLDWGFGLIILYIVSNIPNKYRNICITIGLISAYTIKSYIQGWLNYREFIYFNGIWLAYILLTLYNGQLGIDKNSKIYNIVKYGFYIYYPLHMLILYKSIRYLYLF